MIMKKEIKRRQHIRHEQVLAFLICLFACSLFKWFLFSSLSSHYKLKVTKLKNHREEEKVGEEEKKRRDNFVRERDII